MRILLLLCFILMLTTSAIRADAPTANLIHVDVVNLRNNNGDVGCLLFKSADGFPGDASKAIKATSAPIHDHAAVCEFKEVAPGDYAISATHDENMNGKVDTNFLGIPKEGVGSSNDAPARFGPPKYGDAHFTFKGGRQDLTIHLHYFL